EAFETAFAEKVGARYAAVCSSGTAALHLASLAIGLGKGDAAIVPTMTFLATANGVRYVDAEVAFADVDSNTGLMGAVHVQAALNSPLGPGIKAVIPVHLNGQTAPMTEISALARQRGLKVIEDACHALGTTYGDEGGDSVSVGSCRHSDITVFSFHPVKTVAMGEGGMITTNDAEIIERVRRFRNHGMVRDPERLSDMKEAFAPDGKFEPWYYDMPEPGFNYRASDINCALGLSQLRKLDRFVTRRRELVGLYDKALEGMAPIVRPPARVEGCDPGWHLYAPRIDFSAAGTGRAAVMRSLQAKGIGTQVHYRPVHRQSYYAQRYGAASLPGAEKYYTHCLSLPLFSAMEDSDVGRVVAALAEVLEVDR
ncbi:MAG: aminotransferase class I/II-fold pyridoxal phosphate-dependent enzyme, partial [Rhodospirillales bacterium]|nr:aminotransferase class I/II-fold pyridoxal phosphate-dependent enzyme [Rhodospirillales bacterium]